MILERRAATNAKCQFPLHAKHADKAALYGNWAEKLRKKGQKRAKRNWIQFYQSPANPLLNIHFR